MVLSVSWEERPAQGPAGQPLEAGPEVRRRPVPNHSHAPPLPGKPHKTIYTHVDWVKGGGGVVGEHTEYIYLVRWNRMSVSAHSAGAYIYDKRDQIKTYWA